jgi:hypothetical protein
MIKQPLQHNFCQIAVAKDAIGGYFLLPSQNHYLESYKFRPWHPLPAISPCMMGERNVFPVIPELTTVPVGESDKKGY